MQMIQVSKLKPHPRNNIFFDDITGDKWEDFKNSITRRGVVEGIVISQDYIVVSGHQRLRACKELGITEVPCRVTIYPDVDEKTGSSKEDMILEDLISTNILQRGIGNINPVKMAKCIKELERIYGIRQGSANKRGVNQYQIGDRDNLSHQSQKDLAKNIGISSRQLSDYKKLLTLIPELQDLVEQNELKATTAYKILAKLPGKEQEKLYEQLGKEKISQMTQKQMQQYIEDKKELEHDNEQLKQQLEKEKNKQVQTVEIDNTDCSTIDKLKEDLEDMKYDKNYYEKKVENLQEQLYLYQKDSNNYKKLKQQIETLSKEKNDISRQINSTVSLSGYVVSIENFLKTELSPIQYSKALLEVRDNPIVINNLTQIIECVEKWCMEIRKYLPNEQQNIINVEECINE